MSYQYHLAHPKVFEEHAAEIFDEAENRLHAQKAVMVKLMSNDEA